MFAYLKAFTQFSKHHASVRARARARGRMLFMLSLIVLFIGHLSATCHVCQNDSAAACHSSNTFSICIDKKPTYTEIKCPDGFYCTNGTYICGQGASPLCESDAMDNVDPLPDVLDQETNAWNPDDACLEANRTTNLQNQLDQTWNSYIYCYLSNGIYRAQIRKCKLNEYFNEILKTCSTTQPTGCQ